MRNLFLILALSLLLLSGCYDRHSEPQVESFATQANAKIGKLRQLCTNGCYNVVSDIVCVGRVTTSDYEGNFYRSMFVEDDSGAVEIKLGTYNISAQYPIGLMVAIRLKGASVMFSDGVVQVGLPPRSYDSAPREFEAQEVIDRHIVCSSSVDTIYPMSLAIQSLDISLCGRFVQIENLHYKSTTEDKERGLYCFEDEDGGRIFVEISPYSNFSTLELPATATSIKGILYHRTVGDGQGREFVIKPRSKDDIAGIEHNNM